MNGKEFTQRDLDITVALETIDQRLDFISQGQTEILNNLVSYRNENEKDKESICERLRITENKTHWIIGVGIGCASILGFAMYLIKNGA